MKLSVWGDWNNIFFRNLGNGNILLKSLDTCGSAHQEYFFELFFQRTWAQNFVLSIQSAPISYPYLVHSWEILCLITIQSRSSDPGIPSRHFWILLLLNSSNLSFLSLVELKIGFWLAVRFLHFKGYLIKIKLISRITKDKSMLDLNIHNSRIPSSEIWIKSVSFGYPVVRYGLFSLSWKTKQSFC